MTLHSKHQDENPPAPAVALNQERLLLEIISLFNRFDVPTYFDQTKPNEPRDESKPRLVMEPAQRFRWVFERLAEYKTKNAQLSQHATGLEKKIKEQQLSIDELAAIMLNKNQEMDKLIEERDKALKKVADLMVNPPGRGGSKASRR